MKSMDALQNTITSSLQECDSHLQTMNSAFEKLQGQLPLTENDFPLKDDNLAARLDQFLFRFIKMQDSLAKRLCPAVYQILENNQDPKPFLDILNRLEQLGVLTSVNIWQFFRNLRNNLAHDYPESRHQNIQNLNLLFERWSEFAGLYLQIKEHAVKHAAFDNSTNGDKV
jgi:hypothetical protein